MSDVVDRITDAAVMLEGADGAGCTRHGFRLGDVIEICVPMDVNEQEWPEFQGRQLEVTALAEKYVQAGGKKWMPWNVRLVGGVGR